MKAKEAVSFPLWMDLLNPFTPGAPVLSLVAPLSTVLSLYSNLFVVYKYVGSIYIVNSLVLFYN